jgi:hypothetical protein
MTDPFDLSNFNQKFLAGLGVPEKFLFGDSSHATASIGVQDEKYNRMLAYMQHQLMLKQKNAPQLPKAKAYRRGASKNAKRDFAKRQRRFLRRIGFAKAAGNFIFDKMSEASFTRLIFGPFPVEEPKKRRRMTARERRWRRYHKTEPYPWEVS